MVLDIWGHLPLGSGVAWNEIPFRSITWDFPQQLIESEIKDFALYVSLIHLIYCSYLYIEGFMTFGKNLNLVIILYIQPITDYVLLNYFSLTMPLCTGRLSLTWLLQLVFLVSCSHYMLRNIDEVTVIKWLQGTFHQQISRFCTQSHGQEAHLGKNLILFSEEQWYPATNPESHNQFLVETGWGWGTRYYSCSKPNACCLHYSVFR